MLCPYLKQSTSASAPWAPGPLVVWTLNVADIVYLGCLFGHCALLPIRQRLYLLSGSRFHRHSVRFSVSPDNRRIIWLEKLGIFSPGARVTFALHGNCAKVLLCRPDSSGWTPRPGRGRRCTWTWKVQSTEYELRGLMKRRPFGGQLTLRVWKALDRSQAPKTSDPGPGAKFGSRTWDIRPLDSMDWRLGMSPRCKLRVSSCPRYLAHKGLTRPGCPAAVAVSSCSAESAISVCQPINYHEAGV
ncbi:hypothetical protein BKA56DRAFT_59882 [Ilyonectria sp. MPI-CAGE-AT-0026]|nr:hypothetical protein BKA56DRAFT_59882 [Ilyonectria sp. MPI-CAGE-AT-0026]